MKCCIKRPHYFSFIASLMASLIALLVHRRFILLCFVLLSGCANTEMYRPIGDLQTSEPLVKIIKEQSKNPNMKEKGINTNLYDNQPIEYRSIERDK